MLSANTLEEIAEQAGYSTGAVLRSGQSRQAANRVQAVSRGSRQERLTDYAGCQAETAVELYALDGEGHE